MVHMEEGVRIIYVGMDQALVRIDLMRERLLVAGLRHPTIIFRVIHWLLDGGKARVKVEIANRATLDVADLPYNRDLLSFLKDEQAAGMELVLVTAVPYEWAQSISRHLGLFDHVLATDETSGNLAGERKLDAILHDAGDRAFGYAGNPLTDEPILKASQLPIMVGKQIALEGKQAERAVHLPQKESKALSWWKSLRPCQWIKNLLVFAPAIATHRLSESWSAGLLAFVAFSLAASAFYLWNDFCDIDEDRIDPDKRSRALASGSMRPSRALVVTALLLLGAGCAAVWLPFDFSLILIGYGIVNALYSSGLQYVRILDLVILTALLLLRVFAGALACHTHVSGWLLVFIFFLALSLAHLKRYTELRRRIKHGIQSIGRFTYPPEKASLLMKMGICAGLASVLVLAVEVTASQASTLYRTPALLFFVSALLFYWIERIWALARREKIECDPFDFIATDPISYLVVLASLAVIGMASIY